MQKCNQIIFQIKMTGKGSVLLFDSSVDTSVYFKYVFQIRVFEVLHSAGSPRIVVISVVQPISQLYRILID